MDYYVVTQYFATGNGTITLMHLVTDPEIVNGGLKATKVGECDWKRIMEVHEKDPDRFIYKRCKCGPSFYVGNAYCELCTDENPFGDENFDMVNDLLG